MGFFKNLKEDFSKAVNELLPDEKFEDETVKELSEPGLKQEKDLSETIKEEPETELIEEVLLKDNLRDNKHKAEEKTMAKFRNKSTDTGREPLYDDNVDKDLIAEMLNEDGAESLEDEVVAEGTITNLAGDNVTVIAKGTKITNPHDATHGRYPHHAQLWQPSFLRRRTICQSACSWWSYERFESVYAGSAYWQLSRDRSQGEKEHYPRPSDPSSGL